MEHKNFYENVTEALLRLQGTIVTYDGEPEYVITITDHKSDGAFRIYTCSLENAGNIASLPALQNCPHGHSSMGPAMDAHVDGNDKKPNLPVRRKRMDSKLFNKYRPFPMGMMNYKGNAYFLERKPLRPNTKQGLIPQMVDAHLLTAGSYNPRGAVSFYTSEFRDCVMGDYPSPKESIQGIVGDTVNESIAFHRNFALIRGPIDTVFLGYKNEIVGALPRSDFSQLRLGRKYKHVKEAAQELRLFTSIE